MAALCKPPAAVGQFPGPVPANQVVIYAGGATIDTNSNDIYDLAESGECGQQRRQRRDDFDA